MPDPTPTPLNPSKPVPAGASPRSAWTHVRVTEPGHALFDKVLAIVRSTTDALVAELDGVEHYLYHGTFSMATAPVVEAVPEVAPEVVPEVPVEPVTPKPEDDGDDATKTPPVAADTPPPAEPPKKAGKK